MANLLLSYKTHCYVSKRTKFYLQNSISHLVWTVEIRCNGTYSSQVGWSLLRHCITVMFGFMVFNATFNNISVISWWSVLLVEKTGVPGENYRSVASHWQTLSHNVVSSTPRNERKFELATLVCCLTLCVFYYRWQSFSETIRGYILWFRLPLEFWAKINR